jgi:hypothetical protein
MLNWKTFGVYHMPATIFMRVESYASVNKVTHQMPLMDINRNIGDEYFLPELYRKGGGGRFYYILWTPYGNSVGLRTMLSSEVLMTLVMGDRWD